jgi:hypothetical protein
MTSSDREAGGRAGETASGRKGDTTDATKWLNRTAQGFSPGYAGNRECTLKGRPNENHVCPRCRQVPDFKQVRRHDLRTLEQLLGRPPEAHRSRPRRRPRPRESLFVANWVGIGSMCSVRIAPALRVGDAFRAIFFGALLPRAKALGYSV